MPWLSPCSEICMVDEAPVALEVSTRWLGAVALPSGTTAAAACKGTVSVKVGATVHNAKVGAKCKYSVTATIRRGLKPTTYAISGSYNGTPLDTVAWISVRN